MDEIKDNTRLDSEERVRRQRLEILDGSRMDANAARIRMEMTPNPIMTTVDAILANQRKQYERTIARLEASNADLRQCLADEHIANLALQDRIDALEAIIHADTPASVADEWGWEK